MDKIQLIAEWMEWEELIEGNGTWFNKLTDPAVYVRYMGSSPSTLTPAGAVAVLEKMLSSRPSLAVQFATIMVDWLDDFGVDKDAPNFCTAVRDAAVAILEGE